MCIVTRSFFWLHWIRGSALYSPRATVNRSNRSTDRGVHLRASLTLNSLQSLLKPLRSAVLEPSFLFQGSSARSSGSSSDFVKPVLLKQAVSCPPCVLRSLCSCFCSRVFSRAFFFLTMLQPASKFLTFSVALKEPSPHLPAFVYLWVQRITEVRQTHKSRRSCNILPIDCYLWINQSINQILFV